MSERIAVSTAPLRSVDASVRQPLEQCWWAQLMASAVVAGVVVFFASAGYWRQHAAGQARADRNLIQGQQVAIKAMASYRDLLIQRTLQLEQELADERRHRELAERSLADLQP